MQQDVRSLLFWSSLEIAFGWLWILVSKQPDEAIWNFGALKGLRLGETKGTAVRYCVSVYGLKNTACLFIHKDIFIIDRHLPTTPAICRLHEFRCYIFLLENQLDCIPTARLYMLCKYICSMIIIIIPNNVYLNPTDQWPIVDTTQTY